MEMTPEQHDDVLLHYGILRKSGRYPWGSGKNPNQRSKTFLQIIAEHEKEGWSQAQIAKFYDDKKNGYPFTVADLRAIKSRSVNIQKRDQIRQAMRLQEKGYGFSEIGRQMGGLNESTVRSLLEPGRLEKLDTLERTAEMLKRQVAEKGMVDIGVHVELDLPIHPDVPNVGISKDKFNTAVSMLKEEGYQVHTFNKPQQGTGEMTRYKVLVPPGVTQKEAWMNAGNLRLISEKSFDGGHSFESMTFKKPLNIDSKRVAVRYKEEGGADADGVIYVRPGKKDISLGKSQYAQVRIAVDGTHYLKGMAIYKNDLPRGVDLMFNTNKSSTGNKLDALKPLEKDKDGNVDWTNPFGAFPKLIGGQIKDKDGNVTSAMNLLNEQGDWTKWSRRVSSQLLAKQSPELAESHLKLTYDRKRQELEEIKSLTNPLIKKRLLEAYSDGVDASAVHLKAANLPRQATKVILPLSTIKPNEIYAPTFKNGERVSLVRFPHAGTFEIPELTVNNRNKEAIELFTKKGTKQIEAPDVVGIHPKVAEHLSGADFDGDTVVVIPNNNKLIRNRPPLQGLKDFDPRQYKVSTPDEDPVNGWVTVKNDGAKQSHMGKVTNLITDMTVRGAKDDEMAAAVRHSMVVIDAKKHNLDIKASERDHGILALKKKYQGGSRKGASTLLTKASSRADPEKRKHASSKHPGSGAGVTRTPVGTIDNKTGKKVYEPTGEVGPNGKPRTFRSKKLAETDDAFTLVSDHGGTKIEQIYAEHSNRLKALANESRLEMIRAEPIPRSKSAAKVYATEVAELKSQLRRAQKNAPLERQAQVVAGQIVAQRKRANPYMEESEKKKIRGQALEEARVRTGAKKTRIDITDPQWEAIQRGAVSKEMLSQILKNTDIDKLKERATPRDKPVMTDAIATRAKALRASGATYSEIADALGIPESTLQTSLAGG